MMLGVGGFRNGVEVVGRLFKAKSSTKPSWFLYQSSAHNQLILRGAPSNRYASML